jgi:hypothetical protein
MLNIVGEDKRFVFVTEDPGINTNITICPCSQLYSHWWPIYTETRLSSILHNQALISPLFDHNMCLSPCHHHHRCRRRRPVHAHHYFDRYSFYPRPWCRMYIHWYPLLGIS